MLAIENLSLPPFFSDISFSLERGKIVGILGENGSGKSSLLKAMSRILKPTSGNILYEKQNLLTMPLHESAKIVSLVPQFGPIYFDYCVEEFVGFGRYSYFHYEIDEQELLTALDIVELSHLRKKPITQLSQGERQRAFIARAIYQKSRFLLMDEATSNLDLRHTLSLVRWIRKEKENIAFLITTHDIHLARSLFDEVLLLQEGKIVGRGAPQEVLSPQNLSALFRTDLIES